MNKQFAFRRRETPYIRLAPLDRALAFEWFREHDMRLRRRRRLKLTLMVGIPLILVGALVLVSL